MRKRWLVASDIDGTLLDSHGDIPERNIRAIESFIAAGGLFTIATGRSVNAIRHIVGAVEINCPVIVLNGAAIYDFDSEKYVWDNCLGARAKELVPSVMRELPNIGVEIYSGSRVIIVAQHEVVRRQMIYERLPFEKKAMHELPQDWYKVIFAGAPDEVDEVKGFISTLECDAAFVRSADCYYEMLPTGVTKGTALKELARLAEADRGCVAAIGDYYNDIELLRAADFPAAAGQAPVEVKQLARLQTCVCDDGSVADLPEYLEKNG